MKIEISKFGEFQRNVRKYYTGIISERGVNIVSIFYISEKDA